VIRKFIVDVIAVIKLVNGITAKSRIVYSVDKVCLDWGKKTGKCKVAYVSDHVFANSKPTCLKVFFVPFLETNY